MFLLITLRNKNKIIKKGLQKQGERVRAPKQMSQSPGIAANGLMFPEVVTTRAMAVEVK